MRSSFSVCQFSNSITRALGQMKVLRAAVVAIAMATASAAPAHATPDSYTFDKEHTEVRFSWDHLGMSRLSGRFLDVTGDAQFPEISFKSTEVVMTTAKTANVMGELTINGVTRPATLSVVWNFSGEHPLSKVNPVYAGVYASGFSARTQVLRSEFGITRSIPLVSDEIRITIETEMQRR